MKLLQPRPGNPALVCLPYNIDLQPETSGRGSNGTAASTASQPVASRIPRLNTESVLSGLSSRDISAAGSASNQNSSQLDNALTNHYPFQQSAATTPQLRQQRHPDNVLSDQYSSALQQSRATALELPLHEMSQLRSGSSPEPSPSGMRHFGSMMSSGPSPASLDEISQVGIEDRLAARSLRSESQNLSDSVQVTANSSPPTSSGDRSLDPSDSVSPSGRRHFGSMIPSGPSPAALDEIAARSLRTESQNLSDSVQVTPNSSPPTSSRDRSWDAAGLESPRDFSYGQE
jgi:hypothetical protein